MDTNIIDEFRIRLSYFPDDWLLVAFMFEHQGICLRKLSVKETVIGKNISKDFVQNTYIGRLVS